ncbi:Pancreatic lipase-related protein 2 [Papilio xuthus]|uniref:Pancreatic lipase-related protein 2 n=1 Tax=Papilio xuthus TaxID=66420 RepID=A0A194PW49_PAPXU|nr:Pancreatic lipase-related protein 2 [Papilio xuthus]
MILVAAGNGVPLVPGDNSHYVKGQSRYIWMPDGDGNPILVDLHEPVDEEFLNTRNGANNQSNPTNRQVLVHGNINSVRNSNYRSGRPLKVIVHGWNNNGNTAMNPTITAAFLAVQDANVIVVDWNRVANSNYNSAVRGVPSVGQHLGNFLVWLINSAGGNWNNVHLVGFSLGAHVVGNAGRTAGGRPARITGLDPAGPQWGGNSNALNRNSGRYVECIHTDGRLLGIMDAIGDANFYPNGGRNPQPGCGTSLCSHGRATDLFASSVRTNHFVGRQCRNIHEAELSNCNGNTLNMGNAIINKRGSGIYGLRTRNSWPF